MSNNFDPKLVIEYCSWFECIYLMKSSEPALSQEINKRINNHLNQLMTVGIQNKAREQIKINSLKTMQQEKIRNDARIAFLKKNNTNLEIFEHLIPLGEIHNRIVSGIIEKLKKLN